MGPAPSPRSSLFRRLARAGAREGLSLLLLFAVAGCAPRLKLSDGLLRADAGRTTLVYLHGTDLVRRQGEVEQRIPLARFGCIPERSLSYSQVFELFSGGTRAVVFSKQSNMGGFDLFGHAGRSVTASCVLDLERQEGIPLKGRVPPDSYLLSARRGGVRVHVGVTTGRIYAWPDFPVFDKLEVIDLAAGRQVAMPLPVEREKCDVVETRTELLVACVQDVDDKGGGQVVLARYGLEAWPPDELGRSTMNVAPGRDIESVSFFPDGRHLACIDQGTTQDGRPDDLLDIRNVATGEAAVFFKGLSWIGAAIVEPTADGEGFLLAERVTPETGGSDVGRVRRYGFDGSLRGTWELKDPPYAVIAPSDGKGFWVGFYNEARWFELKARP
ncbi:hypothetical protein [Pyxidicoccus trucidator]|uniref:hypothetical protein n=1 Tax=Pyxidicoccus trucidator TaxID=2709662 RepID=UPI0013D924BC|nr:hypothetical protein [Pyxidicoccus trucidator]